MSPRKIISNVLINCFKNCHSITGRGNLKTLEYIKNIIPIVIKRVATGTPVYDWIVPKEWNLNRSYIEIDGSIYADTNNNILHVVNYSEPFDGTLSFEEFEKHLHTLPELPDAIPYRTAYYTNEWGVCISYNEYKEIKKIHTNKSVRVKIDTVKQDGYLEYGEYIIKGKSELQILVSCYICHPQMANDSLSGVALSVALSKYVESIPDLKFTYRFVFVPETIGAAVYAKHLNDSNIVKNIFAGLVVTTVGGLGGFSSKYSFDASHEINEILDTILSEYTVKKYPFDVHGSDERQYSSNGIRINCVSIFKDRYYDYKYYHTSLDNLEFVNVDNILKTYSLYVALVDELESRNFLKSTLLGCEPMLIKHKLTGDMIGGAFVPGIGNDFESILQILFYCDGTKSIEHVSKIVRKDPKYMNMLVNILRDKQLLVKIA